MESEHFAQHCRSCYAKLLRLYPKTYRERFGKAMEQTFGDLCREKMRAKKRLFVFALWMFVETSAAILTENVRHMMRSFMKDNSLLKFVKYGGMAMALLMVAGIGTLMFISRGKGEDITGIVAPALLLTILSSIAAIVAAALQKRAERRGEILQ
jgi:hypothetical protein